jgi:positive phototaxis protein PixI
MSDFLSLPEFPFSAPTHALATVAAGKEQFLRFHLAADFPALLPVEQVKEVLTIPRGQIIPIPDMPAWVVGIYNWRGEILWMVDLGHLCGLSPWYQYPAYVSVHSAVVLRVKDVPKSNQMIGLVVSTVEDVESCDRSLIQSAPLSSLPSQLATFLYGYWWKSDDEMLAVLNGEAIMSAMPQS